MANIVPFESAKLPAHITTAFGVTNDLMSGGGGFPVISIKGKVFTVKRGDEKTIIMNPGDKDAPAASIEVVILKAYPEGGKTAKVFYATGYTEGSDASPTCYSNDGVAPAADAEAPQAKSCATCSHNQWGSKITENGAKGRECGDTKRLAVATVDLINDPMLVRVPAASLKSLSQFGEQLAKRGVPYQAVVTKIGFDYTVAHPALTFKPVGFIDEGTITEVATQVNSDIVKQITGQLDMPKRDDGGTPEAPAEPKATKSAKTKPAAGVKVEGEKVEVEKVEAAKPAAKEPAVAEAGASLASSLDSIDFDD